jgi:hypothetical protein
MQTGERQMATVQRAEGRTRIFLVSALAALGAAGIGFFGTFLRPSWEGTFRGPGVVYVHGAFVLGWLLLFASQAWWVRSRQVATHRRLGVLALMVAPGVVVSTMALGVSAMRRDLQAGLGDLAASLMLGSFTSPLVFLALVAAGLATRRQPAVHKRLMLMATVAILWPAFFRFRHYFPGVPHAEWVFGFALAQLFLLAAVLADRLRFGRVHPVYWWVGIPFATEAFLETWLFDGTGWRSVACWLAAFFL